MKIDPTVHKQRPWRVHTLASDFTLLDVSRVGLEERAGGDFARFVRLFVTNGAAGDSAISNALFKLRLWLGQAFGWDDQRTARPIPGCTETSLLARLNDADRAASRSDVLSIPKSLPFVAVYVFPNEALLETSNATIHALAHLSWVETEPGRHDGVLAVYLKSRGWFSDLYMALIKPFRHTLVYPAWFARMRRLWRELP